MKFLCDNKNRISSLFSSNTPLQEKIPRSTYFLIGCEFEGTYYIGIQYKNNNSVNPDYSKSLNFTKEDFEQLSEQIDSMIDV